ncbi:MAG: hypothetical protein ACJ8C4_06760 [Gemmataceae bacterium]
MRISELNPRLKTRNSRFNRVLAFILAAVGSLGAVGCGAYEPPPNPVVMQAEDPDFVCVIMLDVSGSYESKMLDDGKAWKAIMNLLQEFYRNRANENDVLVIGQIGAPGHAAPLFEGSPRAFRKTFGDPASFRTFLKANSSSQGSRIFDSICDVLSYTSGRMSGKTKAGVFLFTDFEDNASAPGGEERFVQTMTDFGKRGQVSVGCYWVGMNELAKVDRDLRRTGIKNFVVDSSITAEPRLPHFES